MFYSGYDDEVLNSKWCYAETTSCADATKFSSSTYVDEGRFGASQRACWKDKVMDCFLTKQDSDLCLQESEKWGPRYNCKDSEKWCNTWKKDMHRCCPDTCKVSKETPFNETECNSANEKGKCIYPFPALDNDCYKEPIDGNMPQDGVGNETTLVNSSNKAGDVKAGLAFFVSGFVILLLGILTLIILSRIL